MNRHKDLPPGSQQWAAEVDALMDLVKKQGEVIRRLTENAGLDMANPRRGVNPAADSPSITNPVGQKLSSLADVQTYNVADKQVLSWNQKDQKWLPITPAAGGSEWRVATDDEILNGEMVIDGTWESVRVKGITGTDAGGTTDSYGLLGMSDASAFLHAAGRSFGGPTRAHGFVAAHPYYVKIGVAWVDDDRSIPWAYYGEVEVGRENVVLSTPKYQYVPNPTNVGVMDGYIFCDTNWFYVPKFDASARPVPPSYPGAYKGAMIYDLTLNKPLWWNGSAWADANGTAV